MLIVIFSNLLYLIYMSTYANVGPGSLFFTFGNQPASFSNVTSTGEAHLAYSHYVNTAATSVFVSIVLINLFVLMSVKTNRRSFFQQSPFDPNTRNLWPYGAALVSISICFFCVYMPFIQSVYSTSPLPVIFYVLPVVFGLVIFTLEELRKLALRYDALYLNRIAW